MSLKSLTLYIVYRKHIAPLKQRKHKYSCIIYDCLKLSKYACDLWPLPTWRKCLDQSEQATKSNFKGQLIDSPSYYSCFLFPIPCFSSCPSIPSRLDSLYWVLVAGTNIRDFSCWAGHRCQPAVWQYHCVLVHLHPLVHNVHPTVEKQELDLQYHVKQWIATCTLYCLVPWLFTDKEERERGNYGSLELKAQKPFKVPGNKC